MTGGLDIALKGSGEPGLAGLRRALRDALGDDARALSFAGAERLKPRVFRLRFGAEGGCRSVVAKRLGALEAARGQKVAWRWLPAVGLEAGGPGLLGVGGDARGEWVWHVYEDHGDAELAGRETDSACVAAAVRLVAQLHSRFASHPLLAECRWYGSYGIGWYAANLGDALHALDALRAPELVLSADHAALRDRLRDRLARLLADEPRRARALAECGGPETLLHGDLWTTNVFVPRTSRGLVARLTDWDRAGVGPMSYDLSAFLLRFPASRREGIVDLYTRSLEGRAWQVPGIGRLNLLCETAELSRYANHVIWPALAIARERAAWGFAALAEVERWFEALEPVLAAGRAARPRSLSRAAGGRT